MFSVHIDAVLVKNVCKMKKLKFAGNIKTDPSVNLAKSQRNLAAQYGIYVTNILKRKREYQNFGDPLV